VELPGTMVILMSSYAEDAYRLMASDSGADVFVSKGVIYDALLPAIRNLEARRVVQMPTLGDVLYANKAKSLVSEKDWVGLVRATVGGDQSAMQALYTRTHRIVFTLIVRITNNLEIAEELMDEVYHDLWLSAPGYDPAGGSVVGWIMNQARSRAIDWLRIAPQKSQESVVSAPHGPLESEWEEVAPGISCNLLATDAEKDRVSMLVRLAPGAAYPPHRHAGVEELYLLDGVLMIDDKTNNRAEPGTGDHPSWGLRNRLHVRPAHVHPGRSSLMSFRGRIGLRCPE
jgi:DNA-directed RNA polymerase specialized sigma24 family protein